MLSWLAENPLLLLFLVGSLGYALGRVTIGGFHLGIAAVLFTGLGFGAIHPDLRLPEFVVQIGLVLFVYTIGISSGPGFKRTLSPAGLKHNAFALAVLTMGFSMVLVFQSLFHIRSSIASGLFCGSFTNTPALAAVLESLKRTGASARIDRLLSEPVMAYSVAYPFGVIGVILAIYFYRKLAARSAANGHNRLESDGELRRLANVTVRVTKPEASRTTAFALAHESGLRVLYGRIKRGDEVRLVEPTTVLQPGDLITIVGTLGDLEKFMDLLGEESLQAIDLDRSVLDFRRITVSNPAVEERALLELKLQERFGGIITRVRRGDVEFLPNGKTILEPGDRVRVLAPRGRMQEISAFFGDSLRAVSEIDIISFSLGIALGLLLGSIPIPLPGGTEFKLGIAGGPLIAGLILGMKGRSGPIIWQIPYNANLTIRQLGLFLFLAGIGTRSGYTFASTFQAGDGLLLFFAGATVTGVCAFLAMAVGHALLRIPLDQLAGMLAGIHTQPAVLAYATEQSNNDSPNIGYAEVYPVATVAKIILAQLILSFGLS